jgi:hypothetical protein
VRKGQGIDSYITVRRAMKGMLLALMEVTALIREV